jgi:RNA polymerase sigma-70 factor (ECF subfamily)
MAPTDSHHHDETPDDVLVRLVCEGDEDALSALYRRYVEAIYRFVLAQVRDMQDAEDLTSETFARMLRALSGFRGEASFKNWLYQIARNAVRNHRRSAGYRRTVPLSRTMTAEPRKLRSVDSGDRDKVIVLLQPLPPRYRQVLELRFLEGHSIEETAERMGVTIGNAKVLQHRALRKAASIAEESGVEARSARRPAERSS